MSVRSLGRLTLDLVLQTGNFLGPMDKASRSTKKQMKDMAGSVKQVATAVTASAAAVGAGAAALVAYANNAAQNARELRNQAQVANTSTREFQRWTYAVSDAGIEQDKLSDILKDVNDRVGDFIATGGGPMADFFEKIAPKVGITAAAFRNLSGPQALQLYYDSLEKANLSQEDLTFYLEAMASDTTALIPLLRNGGERISEMADEAERLGFIMSDLEVAQLTEFAGQFDRASAAVSSISNAIASELSPYLSVGIDYLFDAADGADGFRDAMVGAVHESIAWLAQLIDEFLILDKNVQIGTARMSAGFAEFAEDSWGSISWLIDTAIAGINNVIEGMNAIPGFTDLDLISTSAGGSDWMQGFRDQTADANAELNQLSQDLFEMMNSNGPGAQFLADVQAKVEEIKAGLETEGEGRSRSTSPYSGGAGAEEVSGAADAIKKQISALEQQAATLGMAEDASKLFALEQDGATASQLAAARAALESIAAYEASEKAADDYKKLIADLRTEEEKLTAQLTERLAVLDAASVAGEEYAEVAAKIAAAGFADAPEYGGLDATIGGAFGELNKIDEAEEKLQEWYSTQLEMLDEYRKSRADLTEQWDEQERALKEEHENELARIEKARQIAQLAGAESLFGDMASITKAFAGEQSGIYRAMFAVEKAFAIASSIVSIQQGIAGAAALPFPANIPAMASVAAATAGIVTTIQGTGLAGQAHDGIMSVPEDGTWNLQKGERVTTAQTSVAMDNTLAQTDAMLARVESQMNRPGDSGGGRGQPPVINVDARGAADPAATARQVEEAVLRAYRRVGEDFATNGDLRQMLGV